MNKVILDNIKTVKRNIGKIAQQKIQAGKAELQKQIDKIFTKSLVLCPVDTGVMKSTGRTEPVKIKATKIEGSITYGGGQAAKYTIVQHENLQFSHEHPTQAKWLEQPAKEQAKKMPEAIAVKMRKVG